MGRSVIPNEKATLTKFIHADGKAGVRRVGHIATRSIALSRPRMG